MKEEETEEKGDSVPVEEKEQVEEGDEAKDNEEKPTEEFKPENDYSLMDELMEFLEVPEESEDNDVRLEPILCGYFNKVMTALLSKQKGKTLEYLLLFQKGKIFDNLLSHMQHYSLASLLLHFLGMKFYLEDYTGFSQLASTKRTSLLDWDNNSDSDEDENKAKSKGSPESTAAAIAENEARFEEMTKIFQRKKIQVVRTLIGYLSKKNSNNLEKTMNANTVLQELVENETTFKYLVEDGHLELIINTCCEGNVNRMNAPYIKHLLGNIFNEYSQRLNNFKDVKITDFKTTFSESFTDLIFSQCLSLRQADSGND